MAAPNNTVWGAIKGEGSGEARIGISVTLESTNTETVRKLQVWAWTKYTVNDSINTLYYDCLSESGSAKTSQGSVSVVTTTGTGDGWSEANQKLLLDREYTYTRGSTSKKYYVYSKLVGIDKVGATMYASTTFTIPAIPKYTVKFDANGGTGAPSSQTKTYGKTLTLSSTKPTRTGYTFLGWSLYANDTTSTWASGGSYTTNASATLYAVWKAKTYTVSYNANGGTGAPASQTKTYGKTLTLSSTKPTRSGYTFVGWGTSSLALNAKYQAGGSYTANESATLYAVWTVAYFEPKIELYTVTRCNSEGTADDSGTYAIVKAKWSCSMSVTSITVSWDVGSSSITATGTSGTISSIINGPFDVIKSYSLSLTITDGAGSATKTRTLPSQLYTIDFLNGGKGVSFGKSAEKEGIDIGMDAYLRNSKTFYSEGSDGLFYSMFGVDADNTFHFSYGCYNNSFGNTYYNGNNVFVRAKEDIKFLSGGNTIFQNEKPIRGLTADGANTIDMISVESDNNVTVGGDVKPPRTVALKNKNDQLRFVSYDGTDYDAYFYPQNDGLCTLGTTAHRWYRVYATNASISTSDRRQKENIIPLGSVARSSEDLHSELFDRLKPVQYNFIKGNKKTCFGLVAQDVIESMEELGIEENELDLVHHEKMEVEGKESETFGLAYDNLIAMLIHEVQKLKKELKELKGV